MAQDYLEDLCSELDSVEAGLFASSGKLTESNPGLFLHGLGHVGLPLSIWDAPIVKSAATLAPYGKGEETVVDVSVRHTWQLSPSAFALVNPGEF